ncbi:MAG: response regulator, partial [Rhodocyclaceae bacterium]|nr:response regulator [Rhodocyclaceae bacterium]
MPTVLCIEDEAPLLRDITEELRDAGYEVRAAANGAEGLDILRTDAVDLVLCDIMMPEVDGFGVLREVRENLRHLDDTPFLFLSALAEREQVMRGLSLGADDYIVKPIDYDTLLVKVAAHLRQTTRMAEKKQQELIRVYQATKKKMEDELAAAGDTGIRLEGSRQSKSLFSAGKVQVLNLEPIKERLGADWDRMRRKILTMAESTLRDMLGPDQ